MTIVPDYSSLLNDGDGYSNTWREIYDDSLSLPDNVLSFLKQSVFLPHDFYDIIAAYYLLPSALCRVVPYLFFFGASGSGKSTLAKLASHIHGSRINSSGDTFAGIRNDLNARRYGQARVPYDDDREGYTLRRVERNFCMVWEDIKAQTFLNSPDLYSMFRFGSSKDTDKIIISSKEVGENLEFHCFCPKVFSSISPLHLDDRLKELQRRLIVIPCQVVEELSAERRKQLGIADGDWEDKLVNLDSYDWNGFNQEFIEWWDVELAQSFLTVRRELTSSARGLSSKNRVMSIDLLATGIVCGIWENESVALEKLKAYWKWYKKETTANAGFSGLVGEFVRTEKRNASAGGAPVAIHTSQLRSQINNWVQMGWLYESPKASEVTEAMFDLGLRLQKGHWTQG